MLVLCVPNATVADCLDQGATLPYAQALVSRIERPGMPSLLECVEGRDLATCPPWHTAAAYRHHCNGTSPSAERQHWPQRRTGAAEIQATAGFPDSGLVTACSDWYLGGWRTILATEDHHGAGARLQVNVGLCSQIDRLQRIR